VILEKCNDTTMSIESSYTLERPADGAWSWAARFRLPEVTDRDTVLEEIDRSIQAMKYDRTIPLDEVALYGLSGVLIGPKDDHEAAQVQDVIFATDPSRKYGILPAADIDPRAMRTAKVNGWKEVDVDGNILAPGIQDVVERSLVRVIMGRNLDKYAGKKVATLSQARALLPIGTAWETQGGYLFSGRVGSLMYGEAAIVAAMEANQYGQDDLRQLFDLAHGLNDQDRFVLETPEGAEVYRLSQ
jgi:hypothetical protein